ncbi:NADPH-dependent F420 reductase [Arthrobacter sp. JSM 101049]|uniref:NADPH-dependent F420 reductase n=1 Tax=Arthrobacter sp. JSM 101049 TaxID=929097 RepID=UPI003568E0E8
MKSEQPVSATATIGILGAGRVGTAVARQALKAGYRVKLATSKPADEIELLVDIVVSGADAAEAAEAMSADLVVVAVPLHKYRTLHPAQLAGKTVIDVMNYWPAIDGQIDEFADDPRGSSEIIADFLADSLVVKSLNHIGYHELEEDGRPSGAADRRALALAGDHGGAKSVVAGFIDRLGYDTFDAGPLAAGRAFGPGTEIFNGRHSVAQMATLFAGASLAA